MKQHLKKTITFSLFALYALVSFAKEDTKLVYKINIKQEINSSTWVFTQRGFELAKEQGAKYILIHMNTYGGEVLYADSIRTKILNSDIPTYVLIDKNAASAGALISIACNKIYMCPGATIGAATVVNQTGNEMPDKYQSYMRATMRATAEAQGKDTIIIDKDTTINWKRDPLIAEAMVDARTIVPNIIDSTRTLTFTAEEALKHGYCDGIVNTVEELLNKELGSNTYRIENYRPTNYDKLLGLLTSSFLQSLLIMLIIGGIYFELQTPGIGFPLAVSIGAAILYFAPLYIGGLAANWEILLFIIGIILLAVEIFVIPGFGVAGISGIILIMTGLTLSLIENVDFDFKPVQAEQVSRSLLTVLSGIALSLILILYLAHKIGSNGIFRKISLTESMKTEDGYIGVSTEEQSLIGNCGTTLTDLRPVGKVKINGKLYTAISENSYIEKGANISVTAYKTGQIYVKRT